MKRPKLFSKTIFYISWFIVSSIILTIACFIDPYVFAFTFFGTFWTSVVIFFISLFYGWHKILFALACFIPTGIAYAVISTYNWA